MKVDRFMINKRIVVSIVLMLLCFSLFGCMTVSDEVATYTKTPVRPSPSVTVAPTEPVSSELKSSEYPARDDYTYMTTKNEEVVYDDVNNSIPGFIDVISFSKYIDDKEIYFYIEVRELAKTFRINQKGLRPYTFEYIWRISFDTNLDGEIYYDTSLNHQKFWESQETERDVPADDPAFVTIALQQEVRSDYKITDCDFEVDGNTLVYHIEKGEYEELLLIHEDTPFFIMNENTTADNYFNELIPVKPAD